MKDTLRAMAILGCIFALGMTLYAGIADWTNTLPDGTVTGLDEYDDYIREIKTDVTTWYAVEHLSNGSHSLPYLTTTNRIAYSYAQAGTMVFDSTDGYIYRYSGSAWVKFYPMGTAGASANSTTPDVTGVDMLTVTPSAKTTITDFLNGVEGQMVWIKAVPAGGSVIIDHDGSSISLNGKTDFDMDTDEYLMLKLWGSMWVEIGRVDG